MYHLNLRKLEQEVDFHILRQSERALLLQHIQTMIHKERTVYKCNDYLLSYNLERGTMTQIGTFIEHRDDDQEFTVDGHCRQKMCEWSYRIVDHFSGSRKLVAIAQNFVDRFLDHYRW